MARAEPLPFHAGVAQIEVTFDLDVNGILAVSAKETTSGTQAEIRIQNKDKLSDDDVERMVREAAHYKEEDNIAVERVEAQRALETYVHEVGSCPAATKGTSCGGHKGDLVPATHAWLGQGRDVLPPLIRIALCCCACHR